MCEPLVQIPQNAVASGQDGKDIAKPSITLLEKLNLLPSGDDLKASDGIGAAFRGPTSSVSVMEAGATALSKWWAAGLGVSVVGLWSAVRVFWSNLDAQPQTQQVLLWGAAIASAAALLALAYILGSDVRGRSAAMVATIQARSAVATAMIEATRQSNAALVQSAPVASEIIGSAPRSTNGLTARVYLAVHGDALGTSDCQLPRCRVAGLSALS
jgi:hypothetical protein